MRKPIPKSVRKQVYAKYNGHCAYCESDYTDLKEKAKNLFTFTNEFEKEKKKNLIITWSYLIVSYIIYAIFLVPLILIFI